MAENFQDNVSYGGSTLAVSGDAIMVGSTNAGSKSVIFNSSGNQGNLVWGPSANRSISLPDASGVIMLTSQAILSISAGGAAITSGQAIFSNSNGVSFGVNGQTVTGSVAAQTNQTVGFYAVGNTTQNSSTTLDARTLSFDGLGAVSIGYSNGSIQISVATDIAQTNQTIGYYAVGNTTQNSSTTLDARTVSFNGLGIITVGYSNGSVDISATQSAQTIGYYAVGNTTQNSSTTLDARTVSFDGLGAATVGFSNGSVQISVPVQTNQTAGFYAVGNTTQNSSTTLDARTLSFDGLGGVSVGYSNGSVQISAPPYRNASQLLWPDTPWQTNFNISNASFSVQHFNPGANITATQANFLMALSGNSGSTGALTISVGIYTMAGSTMSLASSDSRQVTWTSGSDTTASSLYGGISGTCYRTVNLASWNITKGDYMLGAWFRTTNDGTWRAFGVEGPTIVNAQDANETNNYCNGYSVSSYSTAMAASMNVTDTKYARTGGDANKQPSMIFLGTF